MLLALMFTKVLITKVWHLEVCNNCAEDQLPFILCNVALGVLLEMPNS